jgi:NitT/TauT family transport system substrate-binding protein
VDACFTYEPYLSESAANGNGRIIYTTKDIPDTMIDVLVASDEFLAEHPKYAKRLIEAYYRAQEWTEAHPEEAFALMGEKEGMGAADFGPFYSSFTFFTREQNIQNFPSSGFRETLESMGAFLIEHGFIRQGIPLDEVIWSKAVK